MYTILGWIIILALIIFFAAKGSNNYTPGNWLRGCEEGKEYLGRYGIGVYKDYKCKNKSYTDVIEASMVTLGWGDTSYEVYDGDDEIGYINYDHNFHQYNCAYRWDQVEERCTLKEFVANLKTYEDYKKNKKSKDYNSQNSYQSNSGQSASLAKIKPSTEFTVPIPTNRSLNPSNNKNDSKSVKKQQEKEKAARDAKAWENEVQKLF
jgi:hypothetical protein